MPTLPGSVCRVQGACAGKLWEPGVFVFEMQVMTGDQVHLRLQRHPFQYLSRHLGLVPAQLKRCILCCVSFLREQLSFPIAMLIVRHYVALHRWVDENEGTFV